MSDIKLQNYIIKKLTPSLTKNSQGLKLIKNRGYLKITSNKFVMRQKFNI